MIGRRKFLKMFGIFLGMLTGFFTSMARGKKLSLTLDKVEKLKQIGGWAILKISDQPVLFIRDSETTVKALRPVCSHKQCIVAYNDKAKRIECPCHGSVYHVFSHLAPPICKMCSLSTKCLFADADLHPNPSSTNGFQINSHVIPQQDLCRKVEPA
jgi:hypothetical protein